jgi:dTDP-4-amino-4,6-dideoxygalactose transaminase
MQSVTERRSPAAATKVPFFDLKAQYREIEEEIRDALQRVCRNASFILGEEVAAFEREFAEYCGVKHCVALNSGTSALHLALLAEDVGPGHEVITTPNTFIATAESILYTGARPVFVDIDPATANIDPKRIEEAITPRTRAVVPVHLYGRPADLDPILEIARRHNLAVVEDACQAHGARYRGKRVGGFGRAAVFSFYPSKNLAAYGEGGALTTNHDDVARLARTLRNHGEVSRYEHSHVGYNYRMEGFQGAVLRVKLRRLEAWTKIRQEFARLYRARLAGVRLELPEDDPQSEATYHLFAIYIEDRNRVRAELEARGVGTVIHYPKPLHLQKALAFLGRPPGSFPQAERACEQVLCLPLYPEITAEQVEYVSRALAQVAGPR